MARSFLEHHPEGRCSALIVDDPACTVREGEEPFEVLRPEDLDCPGFLWMAGIYDALELCAALKPWLIARLLEQHATTIAYLDSDLEVHGRLDDIWAAAGEHEIVLTPHLVAPLPRDGRRPDEIDILLSGSYNAGCFAVAPGARAMSMLAWWQGHLRHDCLIEPTLGLFAEQRWMDLIPGLFGPVHITGDPGCNVGFWNLPGRRVRMAHDGFTIDGWPLRLMHFSGFDPARPDVLTRHVHSTRLEDHPDLAALCLGYARRLRVAGWTPATTPCLYDRLPDGQALNRLWRRIVRMAELTGAIHTPPLEPAGHARLLEWLAEPADPDRSDGPNRFLLEVWRERVDLVAAYPDPTGTDALALLGWAVTSGVREVEIFPERLRQPTPVPGLPARVEALMGAGTNGCGASTDPAARRLLGAAGTAGPS